MITTQRGLELPKKILVLDTETISIEKRFIYDVGWSVMEFCEKLQKYVAIVKRQYIIKQFYECKPLFETAYYSSKKVNYTRLLRGRKAKLKHWGHAMRRLESDIAEHNIDSYFAYNVDFDRKAFIFSSEFLNSINPLKNLQPYDIWTIASNIHHSEGYQNFVRSWHNKYLEDRKVYKKLSWLEKQQTKINNRHGISEAGNFVTNAEMTYAYLINDLEYVEEHTSLQDVEIESDILNYCIDLIDTKQLTRRTGGELINANLMKSITIDLVRQGISKKMTFNYNKRTNQTSKNTIKLERF